LLVDADLRKPNCHVPLRAKRLPGLSDLLVGTAKPSDAIQRHILGGASLSFLPAGSAVPSPSDIMAGQSLRGLLDGLRGVYDWVIIDTPPVGAVAEALIIAPMTDGVAIVAGAELVPRKAAKHTLARLQETGARVLGVVLNRARVRRDSSYYAHYYGHYYGHAYQADGAAAGSRAAADPARALAGAAGPRPLTRRSSR
jgi:capsular exopolysaccharide synthesis family protein